MCITVYFYFLPPSISTILIIHILGDYTRGAVTSILQVLSNERYFKEIKKKLKN